MTDPQSVRAFAEAWFAAWNAHDADAIMALYADGIEHSSPFIARYTPAGQTPPTSIRGKAAVKAYFARAFVANPTLRFTPLHVTTGLESAILVYRRMNGDLAAEVFVFDAAGKVIRSISHYG